MASSLPRSARQWHRVHSMPAGLSPALQDLASDIRRDQVPPATGKHTSAAGSEALIAMIKVAATYLSALANEPAGFLPENPTRIAAQPIPTSSFAHRLAAL